MEASQQKSVRSGRPSRQVADHVRNLLLDAARELFSASEFRAVTIRRIAETAGVNGAMVHYYFGDKKGLYLAMVEQVFTPLKAGMEQLDRNHTIEDFVALYTRLLAENPWWPNFVIREILMDEEEFRGVFLEQISQTVAPRLLGMINQEISEKHFRDDLKPEYALLSLIGMTVFPFLSKPIAENALGISVNRENAAEIAKHTSRLFLQGAIAGKTKGIHS